MCYEIDLHLARKVSGMSGGGLPPAPHSATRLSARRERGVVHILLLVLVILGVGAWGISEVLLRSQSASVQAEKKYAVNISEARRALLNYALLAPPIIPAENRAGSYSALVNRNTPAVPHRYFALPCPDTGLEDGNLDGVSDILDSDNFISHCNEAGDILPLADGSRVGRLPWNTFSGQLGGVYGYVRGVGEGLADQRGERFWYAVSRNLTRPDRALNPHWILRQTDGWIVLADNDTGQMIQRVAAAVVSPGLAGGETASNIAQRVPDNSGLSRRQVNEEDENPAFAYLDSAGNCRTGFDVAFDAGTGDCAQLPDLNNYDNLIYYNNPPKSSADDRLAYITAEDLASPSGEGVQTVLENSGNILDLVDGRSGFMGVRDLLETHFRRFGNLPAPAAFSRQAAELRARPAGAPGVEIAVGNITITAQIAQISPAAANTSAIEILLPLKNIRRVYLQAGAVLEVQEGESPDPPYNLALYNMETAFNDQPMPAELRAELETRNIYPQNNLLGFQQNPERNLPQAPAIRTITNPLTPTGSQVYLRTPPPPLGVEFTNPQILAGGFPTPMALAEPALGVISGGASVLTTIIRLADGSLMEDAPPGGLQVRLPAGLRFNLTPEINEVSVFFPGNSLPPSASFDMLLDRWVLQEPWPAPLLLENSTDAILTLSVSLEGLPVVAGDGGFLPLDDSRADFYNSRGTLVLDGLNDANADRIRPGTNLSAQTPSGVWMPQSAISRLPVDLPLFTNARLTLTPLPPPGRPLAFLSNFESGEYNEIFQANPMPNLAFINIAGNTENASQEFTLPRGAHIIYPPSATVNLGLDFAFPPGTRAFLPPGVALTVDYPPNAALPNGYRINTTIAITRAVTLVHGGILELAGDIFGGGTEGARIVLQDGKGVGSVQEIFDIELNAPHQIGDSFPSAGNVILQPLTGRALSRSIAPIPLPESITITAYTRMQILTSPEDSIIGLGGGPQGSTTVISLDAVRRPALPPSIQGTITGNVFLLENIGATDCLLPAAQQNNLLLAYDTPGNSFNPLSASGCDITPFSEGTRLLLPPGAYSFNKTNITSALQTLNIVEAINLPIGTGYFNPEIDPQTDTFPANTGGIPGLLPLAADYLLTLAKPLTGRGLALRQAVLQPDSDIVLDSGDIIPAGSVIDILQGVAWPPGALRNLPRVADELQAVSQGPMYLYFPEAVTLTNVGDFDITDDFVLPAGVAGRFVEGEYLPPAPVEYSHGLLPVLGGGGSESSDSFMIEDLSLAVPAGSFMIIPPGEHLDFLAQNKNIPGGGSGDIALLPENAVIVFAPGAQTSFNEVNLNLPTPARNAVTIPAAANADSAGVIRIGGEDGEGRFAIADNPNLMHSSPLIFYNSDSYLISAEELRTSPGARISAGSVGDIYGNITSRDAENFTPALLPADTAEFLRNFPMFYAVAPECRTGGVGGPDCAENPGGGLEFILEKDERYVLEDDYIPDNGVFITLHSDIASNISLSVALWTDRGSIINGRNGLIRYYQGAAADESFEDRAVYMLTRNNEIISSTGDGTRGAMQFATSGTMPSEEFAPAVITIPQTAPSDAVIRVYFNLTVGELSAITPQVLEDAHYAEMTAVTLFALGEFGEPLYEDLNAPPGSELAESIMLIQNNIANQAIAGTTDGVELDLGSGADLGEFGGEDFVFGPDTYATDTATTVTIPLEGFRPVVAGGDRLDVRPASRFARIGFAGGPEYISEPGTPLVVSGITSDDDPNLLTLDMTQEIPLTPGYLWQGYISGNGEEAQLTFAENTSMSPHFSSDAYLRVHPRNELLNFFGSGNETPEGLDGRSIAHYFDDRATDISDYRLTISNHLDTAELAVNSFSVVHSRLQRPYVRGDGTAFNFFHFIDPVNAYLPEYYKGIPQDGGNLPLNTQYRSTRIIQGHAGGGLRILSDDFTEISHNGYTGLNLWHDGWRVPLANRRNSARMIVRVRNAADGAILFNRLSVNWTPRTRHVNGWLALGANNNPFPVADESYVNSADMWTGRRHANIEPVETRSTTYFDDGAYLNIDIGGGNMRITINPPPFQVLATHLRAPRAASYRPQANVFAVTASVYACPGADIFTEVVGGNIVATLLPPNTVAVRIPGALLGAPADVERRNPATRTPGTRNSAGACGVAGEMQIPSFSSRPRRNASLDTLFAPRNPAVRNYDYQWRTAVDGTGAGNVNPATPNPQEPNDGVDNNLIFADDSVPWGNYYLFRPESGVLNYSITSAPPAPASRANIPQIFAADAPDDFDVRGLTNNNPDQLNRGFGANVGAARNPLNYTRPARYVPNQQDTSPSVTPPRQMQATIGRPVTTSLIGDAVFYMDPSYSESDVGGPPRQFLRLGDNFRITGPGAIVPHFGGQNLRAVADVYAARSRLMYSLFAEDDPDRLPNGVRDDPTMLLHNVYSANGAANCPPPIQQNACLALQNPANAPFWIPMVSGIIAFGGMNIAVAGGTTEVNLVLPMPELIVRDNTGTRQTIYAGSVINPRTGVVRRAYPLGAGNLLVGDGGAEAAVDVSPVHAPVPVLQIRDNSRVMRAEDFTYYPVRSNNVHIIGTQTGTPQEIEPIRLLQEDGSVAPQIESPIRAQNHGGINNIIIEPLGFIEENLFDFTQIQVDIPTNTEFNIGSGEFPRRDYQPQEPHACVNECWVPFTGYRDSQGIPQTDHYTSSDSGLHRALRGRSLSECFRLGPGILRDGNVVANRQELYSRFTDNQFHNNCRTYIASWGKPQPDGTNIPNPATQITLFTDSARTTTVRYDGTRARGFFTDAAMQSRTAQYYGGQSIYVDNNGYEFHFPNIPYIPVNPNPGGNFTFHPHRDTPMRLPGNEAAPFGNPFSWHWLVRSNDTFQNFIPMGGARQFIFTENIRQPSQAFIAAGTDGCGQDPAGGAPEGYDSRYGSLPLAPLPKSLFAMLPCRGTASHYWVGARVTSSATAYRAPDSQTASDEYFAMRLPHRITVDFQGPYAISGYGNFATDNRLGIGDSSQFPYATRTFRLPGNSHADILQVDASSWESVHPYAARFMHNAILANDGGIYPPNLQVTDNIDNITNRLRNALLVAEEMRVLENNDGVRRVNNLHERAISHYLRSESTPGSRASSNSPVYTNAWLRLTQGGFLDGANSNDDEALPAGSVVNPIISTYLPGRASENRPDLETNYQSTAYYLNAAAEVQTATMHITRPALIIPKGTTIRIGKNGGRIENVKAAAIFSLSPLDNITCATGGITGDNLQTGITGETLISQSREGITERELPPNTGMFTMGNPCAWLDDKENTDGDRTFLYRSRRRYSEPYKTRILSNDRTFLLGGNLRLL